MTAEIANELRQAAKVLRIWNGVSTEAAVISAESLHAKISKARAEGWTWDQISEVLESFQCP